MNTEAEKLEQNEDTEGLVADYLAAHPDFFEQRQDLLMELRLPHSSDGTVSLIERQLAALRTKCAENEQQLEELIEVGRKNDLLIDRMHGLSLALIGATNLDEVLTVLEDHLHKEFHADAVELRLFTPSELNDHSAAGEGLERFKTFFEKRRPYCGRLTHGQLDYLFGTESNDISSVALLPLRGESIVGMLAIGSGDEGRFQHDMGTEFLHRLSEIVSMRLELVSEPGA
jgi:uncharacterized protein YigA (DUF484 family)